MLMRHHLSVDGKNIVITGELLAYSTLKNIDFLNGQEYATIIPRWST